MTDKTIAVEGEEFLLSPHTARRGTSDRIRLMKSQPLLDRYAEVAPRFAGGNMVEVGLWDGGSTAYFALLFGPSSLVGFELEPTPLTTLERFLQRRGLGEVVHVHLGVDQTDTHTIGAALASAIGDAPLDVVVDDASHLLAPTTATFEYLFPRLRPGGSYFIEDWSHEHFVAEQLRAAVEAGALDREALATAATKAPEPDGLSRLIVDLVLLAATGNGAIDTIDVRQGLVEVRRGPRELRSGEFAVRDQIGHLGRVIAPRPTEG